MRLRSTYRVAAVAAAALAVAASVTTTAQASGGPGNELNRPGMHIRHGAKPAAGTSVATEQMPYQGGQVVTSPTVYVVFWGSQWGGTNASGLPTTDPSGEGKLYTDFIGSLYGAGDTWSTSTTQYCQGVAIGTINCGASGTHVGHPASSPLKGTWVDTGVTAPSRATDAQIDAEATRAASHFGISGKNVQVVVASPHGVTPNGFGTQYCAWHSNTSAGLPYTNLPYLPDAGSTCGAGYVAPGTSGVVSATEGVTIVGGHEYAETITDPLPGQTEAWVDPADTTTGGENGDKCAWSFGTSGIATLNGKKFAVQSLYSNNKGTSGGCALTYTSATNQS